jgi:excisionase family DNA binding protein
VTPHDIIEQRQILLSVNEAKHRLSVSRSTIYNLLAKGDLLAVKAGARTLIPAESVATYVARLPLARFAATSQS